MNENDKERQPEPEFPEFPEFTEGVDYYFEGGLMILTAEFLSKRGYCCSSGCRHCPYAKKQDAAAEATDG